MGLKASPMPASRFTKYSNDPNSEHVETRRRGGPAPIPTGTPFTPGRDFPGKDLVSGYERETKFEILW